MMIMAPLRMKVRQYSACCERLLEEWTVLTEEEQSLLLFYAREITTAVSAGRLNEPHGGKYGRAA
jgi:hypothetical protein